VYVPAGAFEMGDGAGDGLTREGPAHVVELDAFYIGKFEVTNAQWRRFRDDPGYDDPKLWPDGRVMPKTQIPYWTQGQNHGGGTPDSDDYPVLGVNWDGATAYCRWLSAKTGKTYRLPTEAEWEKAARGGVDGQRYPWGDDEPDASRCHFLVDPPAKRQRGTRPTGTFPPNAYGLYDVSGNVWEWVADWYVSDYYGASEVRDPRGPDSGATRIVRGGAWVTEDRRMLRCAWRHIVPPDTYSYSLGFRIACAA